MVCACIIFCWSHQWTFMFLHSQNGSSRVLKHHNHPLANHHKVLDEFRTFIVPSLPLISDSFIDFSPTTSTDIISHYQYVAGPFLTHSDHWGYYTTDTIHEQIGLDEYVCEWMDMSYINVMQGNDLDSQSIPVYSL